jgi:archaellum component FlaC
MQAYDSEFESIKKDLFDKKVELENIIEEIKSELLQNIDNLSTDINIRISNLEQTVTDKIDTLDEKKVDKKLLGDLLKTLGEKISQ